MESERVQRYLQGIQEMLAVREQNNGADSVEEDLLNEKLDLLWDAMSSEEMQYVHAVWKTNSEHSSVG